MIEVRVAHLGLDRKTNSPVVVLQEVGGQRVLPIWIGPPEASAIAMEMAGVKFARPLTHDLLKQVIIGLGARLDRVLVTEVKDNTYFGQLQLHREEHLVHVDARPSDCIALALRLGAPILVGEDMLGHSSVETEDSPGPPDSGPLNPEELKRYLQNLDPEDLGRFSL